MGYEIGTSILDEESVGLAGEIMEKAKAAATFPALLPVDTVCAEKFDNDSPHGVFDRDKILLT